MQEVLDHLEAIGRPARNVCFVEPKYAGSGPDEQEALAQYFHERYGMKIMHADPAELTLRRRRGLLRRRAGRPGLPRLRRLRPDRPGARGRGRRADAGAVPAEPHHLLDRRRAGPEELLGGADRPAVQPQKYFSADERQVFRRHILWTRLLSDRRTLLPDGQTGDLLAYVRREHETLVLKPNRSYGGEGVVLGHLLTPGRNGRRPSNGPWPTRSAGWCSSWPAFRSASSRCSARTGRVHIEPFYTVMGFAPSKYGLAVLGRASQKQVVNVAQRGGMCAVMTGRPPRPPGGPRASFEERLTGNWLTQNLVEDPGMKRSASRQKLLWVLPAPGGLALAAHAGNWPQWRGPAETASATKPACR